MIKTCLVFLSLSSTTVSSQAVQAEDLSGCTASSLSATHEIYT